MYVCVCSGVTESEIEAEIAWGARTLEDIGNRCGAGITCGTCVDRVCGMLQRSTAPGGVSTPTPAGANRSPREVPAA